MGDRLKEIARLTGVAARDISRALAGKPGAFGADSDVAEMAAYRDTNRTRMDAANEHIGKRYGAKPVSTYQAHGFDRTIAEQRPQKVIVTSMDRSHHLRIRRAMELRYDVITEKPETTDEEMRRQIIDAMNRTGTDPGVTFNYHYASRHTKNKGLLACGEIAQVRSAHFEWLRDARLLRGIFVGGGEDPLGRAAGYVDGAWSILTGIAADKSISTGLPVKPDDLVTFT